MTPLFEMERLQPSFKTRRRLRIPAGAKIRQADGDRSSKRERMRARDRHSVGLAGRLMCLRCGESGMSGFDESEKYGCLLALQQPSATCGGLDLQPFDTICNHR